MDFLKKDKWLTNPVALKLRRKNHRSYQPTQTEKEYYKAISDVFALGRAVHLQECQQILLTKMFDFNTESHYVHEHSYTYKIIDWVEKNIFPVPYHPNK